jgi:methionine-S-sulfoxide reductase
LGLIYLLGFTLGLVISLILIAYFGQQIVNKITSQMQTANRIKKTFGVLIIIVGVAILTGYDKKIEALILNSGYTATVEIEDSFLERFAPKEETDNVIKNSEINTNTEAVEITVNSTLNEKLETITLAGGCFWCTESYFQEVEGVIDAVSGYAGGQKSDASYLSVSDGKTKHREAVQVTYNPRIISAEKILDIYWSHIDPTNTKGQFADEGFQYTTAIFYQNKEQETVAHDSKIRLEKSGLFSKPIATEILPFSTFFKAEEYHQDYYKKASDHYEKYKKGSGRAGFVEETWAKDAAIQFLKSEQTKK